VGIFDHPGNLGSVRGTLFTVHHADWPAYPQGNDFRLTLLQLTAFPARTEFLAIDHIDRSALFIARVRGAKLDEPFATRNFHIAAWDDDLIELDKRRLVDGVMRTSERHWEEDRWQRLLAKVPEGAQMGYRALDGEFIPLEAPDFESYDDDTVRGNFVVLPSDRITITPAGRDFVMQELGAMQADITESFGDRVADLFGRKYYDTCIREACVQLEHEIRHRTGTDAYGDKLVELFVEKVRSDKKCLESSVRSFRQELRAVFKFIRNDFMHNLREADSVSALAMLFRVARVRSLLQASPGSPGSCGGPARRA
jgi:hypothetical protein